MQLLKFITCGSVDDGKSTLIGHILYDSKLLYADQEKALELDSKVGSREGKIDYSLLLDGLMAEREQGITIDVAYRYFTTDKRSFIVADTPGHEEYTRNMAVGASFADLAIILIDAKQGVLVQTKRHARICSLMGIKHFVFAINKMDLVGYSQERFNEISAQIDELVKELKLANVIAIPVSATEGDNVTKKSSNITWYDGPVLLEYLENLEVDTKTESGFYLPVQRVCRPNHTFRGFQGQVEAGQASVGDEITVLPSGEKAHIKSLLILDKEVQEISEGQPVTIQLDREVDVSRGCVLVKEISIKPSSSFETTLLWMDDEKLTLGKNFYVKLGTKLIPGVVNNIRYTIDVNSGEKREANTLNKNEIAVCEIKVADEIVLDAFDKHKTIGELILIDRVSNMTSACGVVTQVYQAEEGEVSTFIDRETRGQWKNQRAITVEIPVGENGFTVEFAQKVEKELSILGRHTYLYHPESSHGIQGVVKHLNDAGILVILVAEKTVDTSVFDTTRGYYKNWATRKNHSISDVVSFIYKASSIHEQSIVLGDFI
ncbi:sulfate adenylyltransferase subunit 1 [Pseudobutyrivibrio sp. YE44]|uniref:sulfate adenylyltransferase subunit 1 n=1 Tax=Pseudobutyrivibrio sp. YE44 TaxID=1520802 RepID=UPI00088FC5D3|nr:GTP-binding protein [Pseudobutyrivibrio sp. YE44]SDB14494.1 sulfate adenylyltransferase subunit 1 [Pseudobutyrivibrio sp. YE44]